VFGIIGIVINFGGIMRNILTGLLALFLVGCTTTNNIVSSTAFYSTTLPSNLKVEFFEMELKEIRKEGGLLGQGPYYTISIIMDLKVTNLNESTMTIGKKEVAFLSVYKDGEQLKPFNNFIFQSYGPNNENKIIPNVDFLSSNQKVSTTIDVPLTKDEAFSEYGEYEIYVRVRTSSNTPTEVSNFKISITESAVNFVQPS
jgi:hypothetical protein